MMCLWYSWGVRAQCNVRVFGTTFGEIAVMGHIEVLRDDEVFGYGEVFGDIWALGFIGVSGDIEAHRGILGTLE